MRGRFDGSGTGTGTRVAARVLVGGGGSSGGLELPFERGDFSLQSGDPFGVAAFLDLVAVRSGKARGASATVRCDLCMAAYAA